MPMKLVPFSHGLAQIYSQRKVDECWRSNFSGKPKQDFILHLSFHRPDTNVEKDLNCQIIHLT